MALEKFIRGKVDEHAHAGLRSTRQRLESAMQQISDWRRETIEAHLAGHDAPKIDLEVMPQDQEIVLFDIKRPRT